jgi:hypothetical protein
MATEPPQAKVEQAGSPDDVPRFSRARTLDHEVRRLPDSSLERRRKFKLRTINEELAVRQTRAGERSAHWARWAAVLALVGLLVAVAQQFD